MTGFIGYFFSLCLLGILVLLGKLLRVKIRIFQKLFLPSSIIAGFLGLLLGRNLLGGLVIRYAGFPIIPEWIIEEWNVLPGILINVVFASLFLGMKIPGWKKIWNYGGPLICYGGIVGFGQYLVAIILTLLVLSPLFGTPPVFACILEVGFSGGHGTAAGMTATFEKLGFPAGGALAQMSATVGIITAVVLGIIFINIAIRRGCCACLNEEKGIPGYKKTGLIPESKRFSIATATVATEAIEPLTFHFGIIALAIMIGWAIWTGLTKIELLEAFPLFPLAMIGGIIVQYISTRFGVDHYFDRDTFDRILGFSLDILVVSAIATIRLDLFFQHLFPFLLLMVTGVVWMTFVLFFLAPRMFPRYWFERSITEFGMQTGVTAMGLLLLRLVDPLYKTGTATAFGLKQMIYEPFLGGGLITALAPIIIASVLGPYISAAVCLGVMLLLFGLSYLNGWINWSPIRKFHEEEG